MRPTTLAVWGLTAFGWLAGSVSAQAAEGAGMQLSWHGRLSTQHASETSGGDEDRYQEDVQTPTGWSGGLDQLTLQAEGGDWQWTSEGRASHQLDYRLDNRWERKDGLYVTQQGSLYPHYYDSSNRFYNSPPRIYELGTSLKTLRGNFFVETGLRNSENDQQVFAGYRHQSRNGETNSYWGAWLRNADPDDFIMFVTPIKRDRDEKSDLLYAGFKHDWGGWSWTARQAMERFRGVDTYEEPGYYNSGQFIFTRYYRNQPRHTTWTTTLGGERAAMDGRLRLNLDCQYAAVQTSSNTDADAIAASGARHYGEHSLNYLVAEHGGRSHRQTLEGRADYTPLDWLRVWGGVRVLLQRAVGVSTRGEEGAEANAVDGDVTTVDESWVAKSINHEVGVAEDLGVEITAFPKTRLALEASLDRSRTTYDWTADVIGSRNSGSEGDWQWFSRYWEQRDSYTLSLRNWAIPWASAWVRYRYRVDDADVNNKTDVANAKPSDPEYTHTTTAYYYPGRIGSTRREIQSALVATSVKLSPRWSVRPQFEHRSIAYRVSSETEPEISSYRSNTVAVGILGQPVDPLTCSVNVARQFALTSTRANSFTTSLNSPNTTWFGGLTPDFDASNTTYQGDVDYTWRGVTTSLTSGVVDGNGDFDTTLVYGGIGFRGPIGRGKDAPEWEAAYKYYDYHEDENHGINDYIVHAVGLNLSKEF